MKKLLIFVLPILFVLSCAEESPKAKLEALTKQRDELNAQIEKLETELAKSDTSAVKVDVVEASVESVVAKPFNHYVEVQGKLDGAENLYATAQTPGIVKSVLAKEGDAVKKGQVLAYLDDGVLQQSLTQMKSQLVFVTDIYNRQKALWDQKIGSEVQYLSAKNNKESLENQIKTIEEQVDMYRIKSPITGTIEEVSAKIGQMASPGLPAFKVINFSTVKIVAEVSESYSKTIKKGDDAILFFPDLNKEMTKKLDFASKFINPVNRTFQVIVQFVPESDEFRANMLAVVKVNDYANEKAVVVPINYVQTENSTKYVFVAEAAGGGLVAKKRIVKVGLEYGGVCEITEGLNVGDKVITSNFQNIYEGVVISN